LCAKSGNKVVGARQTHDRTNRSEAHDKAPHIKLNADLADQLRHASNLSCSDYTLKKKIAKSAYCEIFARSGETFCMVPNYRLFSGQTRRLFEGVALAVGLATGA